MSGRSESLRILLTPEERARIDRMLARLPKLKMARLVRAAIRVGLDAFERDPELLRQYLLQEDGLWQD